MKKLFLLLISIFLFLSTAIKAQQVEVKGIVIGSKSEITSEFTSLIGYDYYLSGYRLNDNTIAALIALPSEGQNVRRSNYSELTRLIEASENKYGIEYKFIADNTYSDEEGYYTENKNGYTFRIIVKDYNEFMDNPYDIYFLVMKDTLYDQYLEEEQERANSDF